MVLLDEIEKAHPDVFNILLQVLEDGRLTDNKGRVANFKNTIIIMTSNMGSDIIREKFQDIQDHNKEEIMEQAEQLVFDLLKRSVRPEFLNRIDEIIMFSPLSRKDIRGIVELQLNDLKATLAEQDISIMVAPEAMDWLAEEGYHPEFGARPLKRLIQKKVLKQLSKQILLGQVQPGSHIVLDIFDGVVVFRQAIKEEEAMAEEVVD